MFDARLQYALMLLFASAASALCGRLLLSGRRLPGCRAGSGCDQVLASRWARWGRLPVALVAMAGYLAAADAALLAMAAGPPRAARFAGPALLALAPVFAGAAVWFAALQLLAVRRLCGHCLAVHAAGAAVALLAVTAARGRGMEWAAVAAWTTPGWAALGLFIAGHVLLRPRLHEVLPAEPRIRNPKPEIRKKFEAASPNDRNRKPPPPPSPGVPREGEIRRRTVARRAITEDPHPGPLPEYREKGEEGRPRGSSRVTAPREVQSPFAGPARSSAASRRIRAFGGRIDLAVNEWPLLGMPGGANVPVFLFDYTCRECRHMRRLIAKALDRHPGRLAVLLVPIPMDPDVLGTGTTVGGQRINDDRPALSLSNRPDAVGYVRLAWALWRADPLAYMRFDHWLSGPACAPPLRDAVAAARKLSATADLNTSGGSELGRFIDERTARAVAIYRALEGQPVPALLFPGTALRGHIETAEELTRIIEREMRIGREPPRPRPRPVAGRLPVGTYSENWRIVRTGATPAPGTPGEGGGGGLGGSRADAKPPP